MTIGFRRYHPGGVFGHGATRAGHIYDHRSNPPAFWRGLILFGNCQCVYPVKILHYFTRLNDPGCVGLVGG